MTVLQELEEFDWLARHEPVEPFRRQLHSLGSVLRYNPQETPYERRLRFLQSLSSTCMDCTMCELGRKEAVKDYEARDPHVFSALTVNRVVICGQGPGWGEVRQGQPFVGASGANLDVELSKHGLSRANFYITNAVKCYVKDNGKPNDDHISSCRPFLDMEIGILKPYLVVTLGAVAFGAFCPDMVFLDSVGKAHHSDIHHVKVFAAYHPSPLNMADKNRRDAFSRQIGLICAVTKRMLANEDSVKSVV